MLKNSAAGLNVAGWIKSFKVSLMLTFAYIVTSGLVGLLLLLEWEIQVERSFQMKILKHQNKSGICLGRAGFFT